MGYNSLLFICNDALGEIDKDPAGYWRKTYGALNGAEGPLPATYGHGNHCNGFQAVWNDHMDVPGLLIVGGNTVKVLNGEVPPTEAEVRDMKQILEKHGYNIVKRPLSRKMAEAREIMKGLLDDGEVE